MRRPDRHDLMASVWAVRRLRHARRSLRTLRLEEVRIAPPPQLPGRATRGVLAVLKRGRATCLERSLILQAWHGAHGRPVDVVIGVTPPSTGFEAHAWLDGEDSCQHAQFAEITRLAPQRP